MRLNGTRLAALGRMSGRAACLAIAGALLAAGAPAADTAGAVRRTTAEVIAAAGPADWRTPDPANTVYLQLAAGRVVIELAPAFAPQHAANLRTLIREGYFDGLAVIRSQDNFVVQWGDADGKRPLKSARSNVPPEFTVPKGPALPFTRLPDATAMRRRSGSPADFRRRAILARRGLARSLLRDGRCGTRQRGRKRHGAELYVVTGHAPRQLDRNIALVGRVVKGIELLVRPAARHGPARVLRETRASTCRSSRCAWPRTCRPAERANIEMLRTDTPSFAALVEARRNRQDEWYLVPAGYIDVCNVPIPVRTRR